MDVKLPNGAVIRGVPDGTSKDIIKQKAISAGLATMEDFQLAEREISKPREFAKKVGQGMTFGFMDELAAATVGAMASVTGGDFRDAYSYALDNIRQDERAFEQQNPKMAMAGELAGAVATGGVTGSRALGGKVLQNASTAGKYGRIAAVGGAEGAAYGAGTAEEGNRVSGAVKGGLTGAVAGPVMYKGADLIAKGGKTLLSYGARKIADTPRSEAIRAVRQAAINEGIDADDAVRIMNELGPNATFADIGENFRSLARAATDEGGGFKTAARDVMNSRQMGQQDRILDAAEIAAGVKAGGFKKARQALIQGRSNAASPLYKQAFEQSVETTPELVRIMQKPSFASSMKKAGRMAADEGIDIGDNLLQTLHYAKMDLDDKIGAAIRSGSSNKARILQGVKRELLDEIDSQNSAYKQARELFSSSKSMENAMDTGMDLITAKADDLAEAVSDMTASEKDMFRLGAVRSIKDLLDNTNMTHDATRKLVSSRAMRDKLALVFDNPDEFIKKTLAEQEFSRTRNVLTGGSPTAERLAGQKALSESIQPELISGLVRGDPLQSAAALLKIFGKHKVTPELVDELANIMLKQNVPEAEIRKIFATPILQQRLGGRYNEVVLPALTGALANTPAITQE